MPASSRQYNNSPGAASAKACNGSAAAKPSPRLAYQRASRRLVSIAPKYQSIPRSTHPKPGIAIPHSNGAPRCPGMLIQMR